MHIASTDRPLSRSSRVVIAGLGLTIAITVLASYTFLHESGHAALGLLFGGSLTDFNISFWNLNPHVGLDGDFSAVQGALVAAGGMALPLLIFAAFVALVVRRPSAIVEFLRLAAALCVLNTLLPWMFIPLLYAAGRAPADDVTNFLRISQAPPVVVAVLALALYAAGWLFFFRRLGGVRPAWEHWRQALPGLRAPDSMRDFRAIAAGGLLVLAAAGGSSLYFQRTNPLGLPPGYREVARVALAEEGLDRRPVYGFTLEGPQRVSFLFVLQDIETGPGEIGLAGPDGSQTFFKIGQSAKIGRATVNPKDLSLSAGEYRVELTFPRQGGGQVGVYVNDGR